MSPLDPNLDGLSNRQAQALQIVMGALCLEELQGSLHGESLRRSWKCLESVCGAPPLNRARLASQLRRVDQEDAARFYSAGFKKVGVRRVLRYSGMAAAFMLCFGLALHFGTEKVRISEVGKTNRIGAEPGTPRIPRRIQAGVWQFRLGNQEIEVTGIEQARVAKDGSILFEQERAEIVSKGASKKYHTILTTPKNRFRIAVRGETRCVVRRFRFGDKSPGFALSVYSGGSRSVRVETVGRELNTFARESEDLVFRMPTPKTGISPKDMAIRWVDAEAPVPSRTRGQILLRLVSGQVIRGEVVKSSDAGIILKKHAVPTGPERLLYQDPQAYVTEEITAWASVRTPRGRARYAEWLNELLPAQLKAMKREWIWYLADYELMGSTGPLKKPHWIRPKIRYPEVRYGVKKLDKGLVLYAQPVSKNLGRGWQMDEAFVLSRIEPTKEKEGDEF